MSADPNPGTQGSPVIPEDLFPLNSSVSFYSYFNGNILFLTLALLIAMDRDIKPLPELDSLGQADATGLQ